MPISFRLALPVVMLLSLAACDSPEERAEAHYQSALALIADGDIDRAKVELRNVFENMRFHEGGRRTLADILLSEEDIPGAYRNYLFIVEEQPENAEVRLLLAELAVRLGNLEEAKRHGTVAIELTPEEPRVQVVKATFDYQTAIENQDPSAATQVAETARQLLADMPDNELARRIVIDDLLKGDNPLTAMPEVDEALNLDPDSYVYNQLKLQLLAQADDMDGIGEQLRAMVALFPNDETLSGDLIRWYLAQGDNEGAEAFLRELAGATDGPVDGHLAVVQFLRLSNGSDAAQEELNALAEANAGDPKADLYAALSAVITFENGEAETAVSTMEEIVSRINARDTSDPQDLRIKVMLARLLAQTGNSVGARAQVEEVLTKDSSNVDALKMRAAWAIQDDDPRTAIVDLRTALGQAPRDAEILTLMAEAHQRDGSVALAGERLAQAVEVTNSAAPEALRYARFLLSEDRTAAALSVLTDARATSPNNVEVMTLLGQQLLNQQSWLQVRRIVEDLRQVGTTEAEDAARTLQAALLVGQDRVSDSLSFLQSQMDEGTGNVRTVLQVIQLNIQSGDLEAARSALDNALAVTPDDATLGLADGNLKALEGDLDGAEAAFRAVMAAEPAAETPVRQLYLLLRSQDRNDEASAVITEAIDRMDNAPTLAWIRASELENAGDIDGAIAIYETLYERNSANTIIANNLASLITTYRDDADSLARAEAIARRLRDADVPAFQDTYGWILYRQGEVEDALPYLRDAAAGLPNDALVQYHYGIALKDAGQVEAAKAQLQTALDVAGDSDLPQFDDARAALEELEAMPAE